MSHATLHDFASTSDAVAATPKKLEKYALLGTYFSNLADDEDLRRAVRYAGGRTFAATDERVLAVGGAIVSEVLISLLGIAPQRLHDAVIAAGEMGEAVAGLWSPPSPNSHAQSRLTLEAVAADFDALACTGSGQQKRDILTDLFARCVDGREAAYLAKIIFGDLRTGVQDGVLIDAIARAFGRGRKDVQRAVLLSGDLGDVAVMARHDRLASAAFTLFHPIQFMLATAQETPADAAKTMAGRTFFAEDKLDGIRAQVHKQADCIAIYTRTMDRTEDSFPEIVEALRSLPGDFLLDGEIVPFRDGKVLPFAHIQKRLGRKVLTGKMIRDNPAVFIAFDVLYRDGEPQIDKPLGERRRVLEDLAEHSAALQTSRLRLSTVTPVTTAVDIDRAFCTARDCRNEGLVLKDPDSPYLPGRRGKAWLKLKTHLPTFDCVVTAAETGHGKRRNSLSDYTFAVWDREPDEPGARLLNIGKAYSGVTDAEIARLTELFTQLTRRVHGGRVREVEPRIILEIACDQIQESARHSSGYALRFPRIKRIRWDKTPQDADRLARIVEVYQSLANFGRAEGPVEPEPVPEPTLFDLPP